MLRVELIRPIQELLVERAAQLADKVAFFDDNRSVSYAELEARTARFAGQLAALGVAPGERVLIYLGNRVETAESYLALPRAGVIGVCVNPSAAPAEVGYQLDDSDAKAVITDDAHVAQVRALLAERASSIPVVLVGEAEPRAGELSFERMMTEQPAVPARDDLGLDEVAWMLYTSGTTGRPKGVLLTQRSCLWVVAACWAPIVGMSTEDNILCPLPLFHSYALDMCVLGVVAVGATERILPRFSTARVFELLASEQFTLLPGVPTMFQYLVNGAGEYDWNLSSLRMCVSAGAIMPAALNAEFERVFGVQLLEGYGITETSTMVIMNWPTGGRVLGSCGIPVPGVGVRLVDPATGADVGVDEEGELWVHGPGVMVGYHNRPDATADVLQDGWYRTGDLGTRDANGFYRICGRTKELIIRGGENIYPAEVEAALMVADGVADVAVVGREHPDLGEVPVAFVVPEGPEPPIEQLVDACRERLAYFKVPAEIHFTNEIPRTGSGKIMRYRLQERLQAADTPVG